MDRCFPWKETKKCIHAVVFPSGCCQAPLSTDRIRSSQRSIKPRSQLRSSNSSCVQRSQSILVSLGSIYPIQSSGIFNVRWRVTLWDKDLLWREALNSHPFSLSLCAHFGDKSCRQAKGELLEEEGDTPSIFPGESVEEPTLLRLPSNRSGEWLKESDTI